MFSLYSGSSHKWTPSGCKKDVCNWSWLPMGKNTDLRKMGFAQELSALREYPFRELPLLFLGYNVTFS